MKQDTQDARDRLLSVIKHLRYAFKLASEEGQPELGIMVVDASGGGQVIARMEAGSFLNDLELAIEAPPSTTEDELDASALRFLQVYGLKKR